VPGKPKPTLAGRPFRIRLRQDQPSDMRQRDITKRMRLAMGETKSAPGAADRWAAGSGRVEGRQVEGAGSDGAGVGDRSCGDGSII
jgi:hypothetical protein